MPSARQLHDFDASLQRQLQTSYNMLSAFGSAVGVNLLIMRKVCLLVQVEIITVDGSYQPTLEGDATYKPKVATWGVFPRPENISKAFGGGRTIRPGEVGTATTAMTSCDTVCNLFQPQAWC